MLINAPTYAADGPKGKAQQALANGSFEKWESVMMGMGKNPQGWATPNKGTLMGGTSVVSRSTDAYRGKYAAEIKTKMMNLAIFKKMASGALFIGEFNLNLSNPRKSVRFGEPFSQRPLSFKGAYKYLPGKVYYDSNKKPVAGKQDHCAIYAALYKNGKEIARAQLKDTGRKDKYTPFNIPFVYTSNQVPDKMTIVFASSARGEFFEGADGSRLLVDDISLVY